MRHATVALALIALLCVTSTALAATLPLHTVAENPPGSCAIPDPCPNVDTEMPPGSSSTIYILVANFAELAGLQSAYDWGGNVFTFGLYDCQGNQVVGTAPNAAGGPTNGTLATAFDCVQGGATAVIGRLFMIATGQCVTQVESSFPFGTHVLDCSGGDTHVGDVDRGSICAGAPGRDACAPSGTPVEQATWGGIKAQYNR